MIYITPLCNESMNTYHNDNNHEYAGVDGAYELLKEETRGAAVTAASVQVCVNIYMHIHTYIHIYIHIYMCNISCIHISTCNILSLLQACRCV